MKHRNVVIITGGTVRDEFVLSELANIESPYIIGADAGVRFLYRYKITPDYIVGDFDSLETEIVDYYKNETHVPIREFNPVKDASDTEIAFRMAVERKPEQIYLFGATGTRLDHVMANIQTLKIALDAGVNACIMDECNRISLIEKEAVLMKETQFGKYFSVFPLDGIIEEFSIEGAEYPLHNHTLTPYDSFCVSNEMREKEVKITFPKGTVILMETRDRWK